MGHRKRPYSAWKRFDAKMRIDPRFTGVGYLSLGVAVLFAVFYAFTGLEIFRWLTYFSIPIILAIAIGGLIVNIRNRS